MSMVFHHDQLEKLFTGDWYNDWTWKL